MRSKKAMEMEVIVKAILALLILAGLAGLIYIFVVQRGAGGAGVIVDETAETGDGVLSDFMNLIGRKCDEDADPRCGMTGKQRICEEGKWVTTDDPCEES